MVYLVTETLENHETWFLRITENYRVMMHWTWREAFATRFNTLGEARDWHAQACDLFPGSNFTVVEEITTPEGPGHRIVEDWEILTC